MQKEPTFRLDVKACSYNHLTLEQLTEKLLLIKKLEMKQFYTIIEDTTEPEIKPPTKTA
jgi:hypothetical protein